MRVLIFTPTWIDPATGEDAVHPDCVASIQAQSGVEFEWHVTADNPYPVYDDKHERVYHYENVLHQYRQAREYFLRGTWDALLTVEHDNMLPDSGVVQRMAETMETTGAGTIYAPYLLRHSRPYLLSTFQWINRRNLGMSLSHYPRELKKARKKIVYKVSGAGMGCTLFRRAALEAIEFEPSGARNACPDLGFAEAALRAGFESFGRFDVPVVHWHAGQRLDPFPSEEKIMKKYLARETLHAIIVGRRVRFVAGSEIELSDEEAEEARQMGYLEPSPSPSPQLSPWQGEGEQIIQAEIPLPEINAEAVIPTPTARRRVKKKP